MRIGLLADTHIPQTVEVLPSELLEAFRGVDLIFHAGDIYALSVLDDLEHIAPVLAAKGDDDPLSTLRDKRVKEKHVLKIEGQTLWLIHDRAYYLVYSLWKSQISSGQGNCDIPDIIVFGHEHRTVVERLHGILFVSPGSPTFLEYRLGLGTVGILDINSGEINARILRL